MKVCIMNKTPCTYFIFNTNLIKFVTLILKGLLIWEGIFTQFFTWDLKKMSMNKLIFNWTGIRIIPIKSTEKIVNNMTYEEIYSVFRNFCKDLRMVINFIHLNVTTWFNDPIAL